MALFHWRRPVALVPLSTMFGFISEICLSLGGLTASHKLRCPVYEYDVIEPLF